jgi:hypothetical protein
MNQGQERSSFVVIQCHAAPHRFPRFWRSVYHFSSKPYLI